LSSQALTFANQTTGTSSAAQTITLTNSGPGPLTISGISAGGANASDHVQSNNFPAGLTTLTLNVSCVISVTFAPTATGSRIATIGISDICTSCPQSIPYRDTFPAPRSSDLLSSQALTFANQTTGTSSAAQTITLTNSGPGPLTIGGI